MNALFLSRRWLDSGTVTASSTQGTLAASNVLLQDPTNVWRSTGAAAEWLAWDFGTPRVFTAGIWNAVNWSADAMVRIRLGTSAANVTAAPGFDTTLISPWPSSGPPPDDWLYRLSLTLAAANETAYQFGRIDIEDPTNPDGYLEIGRGFGGEAFVPDLNVDINPSIALASSDEVGRTPFNHTIGDDRGPASRLMSVPMSALNEPNMRDELFELQRYLGLSGDFGFCLDPDATDSFHLYAMQCRFASLAPFQKQPVWSDVSQLWQTTLNLEEIN